MDDLDVDWVHRRGRRLDDVWSLAERRSLMDRRLVTDAARGVLARIETRSYGCAVRTQAAVVRSLVDELERHLGSDGTGAFLRDQVADELLRLMRLEAA